MTRWIVLAGMAAWLAGAGPAIATEVVTQT